MKEHWWSMVGGKVEYGKGDKVGKRIVSAGEVWQSMMRSMTSGLFRLGDQHTDEEVTGYETATALLSADRYKCFR